MYYSTNTSAQHNDTFNPFVLNRAIKQIQNERPHLCESVIKSHLSQVTVFNIRKSKCSFQDIFDIWFEYCDSYSDYGFAA